MNVGDMIVESYDEKREILMIVRDRSHEYTRGHFDVLWPTGEMVCLSKSYLEHYFEVIK